jgi:hypothetical protein
LISILHVHESRKLQIFFILHKIIGLWELQDFALYLLFWYSMIGAAIIVIGFYVVMWAQAQEEHTSENNFPPSSATPLLSTKNMDH